MLSRLSLYTLTPTMSTRQISFQLISAIKINLILIQSKFNLLATSESNPFVTYRWEFAVPKTFPFYELKLTTKRRQRFLCRFPPHLPSLQKIFDKLSRRYVSHLLLFFLLLLRSTGTRTCLLQLYFGILRLTMERNTFSTRGWFLILIKT